MTRLLQDYDRMTERWRTSSPQDGSPAVGNLRAGPNRVVHRQLQHASPIGQAGPMTAHGQGPPAAAAPTRSLGELMRQRRQRGIERRELADLDSRGRGGITTLRILRALGVSYDETHAEISAGRWHRVGRRAISVTGPLPTSELARWWWAVVEVGGGAALDGESSLQSWGLARWVTDGVHVSIDRGARYHRTDGVTVHVLRDRGETGRDGIPRTPAAIATLRAAMWAKTDRQAAALLSMPVQQRIVTPAELTAAWSQVGRCPRKDVLSQLVPLVADGAQALSEIDFARLGADRGWPQPDRQAVMRTPRGRIYLDVRFRAYRTICEVNGIQHYEGTAVVDDAVRRNAHAIGTDTALEIPAVGLVLDPRPLLDQVEQALRKGGWPGPGVQP